MARHLQIQGQLLTVDPGSFAAITTKTLDKFLKPSAMMLICLPIKQFVDVELTPLSLLQLRIHLPLP